MTQDDPLFARCRSIIKRLNKEKLWKLSKQAVEVYTVKIAELVPEIASDDQLRKRVEQYHRERVMVRALLDPNDPDHRNRWEDIFKEVSRIVYWRKGEKGDVLLEADDLIQIANINVIKAIKSFNFRSTLSTWLVSVVVNSIRQANRDATAKRRSGLTESIEDDVPIPADEHPEGEGNATALIDLVRQVLAQHKDKRLLGIFLLAEVEGWSKIEIAQFFQLHPSRIRALLKEARTILRQDPSMQSWLIGGD